MTPNAHSEVALRYWRMNTVFPPASSVKLLTPGTFSLIPSSAAAGILSPKWHVTRRIAS